MVRGGAAAAADDVRPAVLDEAFYDVAHVFGRLVILRKLVRQTGVGMCRDEERGFCGQFLNEWPELFRPKGTVQTDAQQRVMRHCNKERLEGLPRKCAAAGI